MGKVGQENREHILNANGQATRQKILSQLNWKPMLRFSLPVNPCPASIPQEVTQSRHKNGSGQGHVQTGCFAFYSLKDVFLIDAEHGEVDHRAGESNGSKLYETMLKDFSHPREIQYFVNNALQGY
jgi:hypothetical protein